MNDYKSIQCIHQGISLKCYKPSGIYYSELGKTVIKDNMECIGNRCTIAVPFGWLKDDSRRS